MTTAFLAAALACLPVPGDRITAGDLARAVPALAAASPETPVGYAPVPGARRIFHHAELRRLALRFAGNVGVPETVCIERPAAPLEAAAVRTAIVAGFGEREVTVEVLDLSRFPVPPGTLEFPRGGAAVPERDGDPVRWRGFVRSPGGQRHTVWAVVTISARTGCWIAAGNLKPGVPIAPEQIRFETRNRSPLRPPAATQPAGMIPRRPVAAGAVIEDSDLDRPHEVLKGDRVDAEVCRDSIVLRVEGIAQTSGRRGDAVVVKNAATGRTFTARVAGKGKVTR
jgi:flagella basal body P-ring formation protein FlgA